MAPVRMPQGHHFALTWSIPDHFGGMTAAMLHRSAAFARLGGAAVDVLTFDARPDTSRLEQELRDRGVLADGVRVLNLYDWLREHPLPGGSLQLDRDVFTPLEPSEATELQTSGDVVMSAIRRDRAGRMLQIDHYRDDGTLVLSDRRDTRSSGTLGGRSVVLCGPDGRPTRSWRRIWPLYTAWLDALTAGRPSFIIVDSKTVAPFMLTYRRAHVITAHVVHGSHRPGAGEEGTVRASRREVFEHLDAFDLVALLTRRQATEVRALVGRRGHIAVIPNAGTFPAAADLERRDPSAGVVLASLIDRKRVSDAIDAVQLANTALPAPLRLDVYGDGPCRDDLERRVTDHAAVKLHGFDPVARSRLADASFLVLTSRSEGFPLVLVESMAAGCLPVAYDIRYGPADVIRDGRNGFLVPPGDVEALAATLRRLRGLPPERVAAMRRRAVRSALRFDDERVTVLWAHALWRAAARKRRHSPARRLRAAIAEVPGARRLKAAVSGRRARTPAR